MSWLDKPDDDVNVAWPKRIYYRIVIELFRSWLVRPIDVLMVLGTFGLIVGITFWPDTWPMRVVYLVCVAFLAVPFTRGKWQRGSFQWMVTGALLTGAAYTVWTWL